MSLPNSGMDAVPFTPLTAEFLDDMIENIESLSAGTGLANAAITPAKWTNPYKFSAYRNAAHTPNNNIVLFDTELFDSNNNFDITTNKGRYTAPVNGFYQFNANLTFNITGSTQDFGLYFMKNGARVASGPAAVNMYGGITGSAQAGSVILQLVAGDYVEVFCMGTLSLITGPAYNQFSAFIVSQT